MVGPRSTGINFLEVLKSTDWSGEAHVYFMKNRVPIFITI